MATNLTLTTITTSLIWSSYYAVVTSFGTIFTFFLVSLWSHYAPLPLAVEQSRSCWMHFTLRFSWVWPHLQSEAADLIEALCRLISLGSLLSCWHLLCYFDKNINKGKTERVVWNAGPKETYFITRTGSVFDQIIFFRTRALWFNAGHV